MIICEMKRFVRVYRNSILFTLHATIESRRVKARVGGGGTPWYASVRTGIVDAVALRKGKTVARYCGRGLQYSWTTHIVQKHVAADPLVTKFESCPWGIVMGWILPIQTIYPFYPMNSETWAVSSLWITSVSRTFTHETLRVCHASQQSGRVLWEENHS